MNKIQKALKSLTEETDDHQSQVGLNTVSQEKIESSGLQNVLLRDYQLFGVEWLLECFLRRDQRGCILGDEMGLGKTVQSIAFILQIKAIKQRSEPCLILSPLSVMGNWEKEFARFASSLNVFSYIGDKEKRMELRDEISTKVNYNVTSYKNIKIPFDVCLTSYEICLKDAAFLRKFHWRLLIVDEAHRLKNHTSLLHQELTQFDICFHLLLTGTPVQNNLKELYSLLSFVSANVFDIKYIEEFTEYFKDLAKGDEVNINDELHALLKPFLLRRLKAEVVLNLPKKSEVLLSIGMSALQKKLYKAILTKDINAFSPDNCNRMSLMNILMQLRKCCSHPYIFPGIEKEPFELGDHLIYASGKLHTLDIVLSHLKQTDHKVLLFSQFTTMLDIIQDYLTYKGYTYERLDGSVRGEERYLAINKFNESDEVFIFLLSTKAGGQGLNLMTADTVIFMDSDFNPQNDLQAAARAHRIGQTRPVKIIRLVTKNSVEEIILKRACKKMQLTNAVIEGGQFSNLSSSLTSSADELSSILKFGLENLLESEDDDEVSVNLLSALGGSCNGHWLLEEDYNEKTLDQKDTEKHENMYVFEGHDYSKETSEGDKTAFENMIEELIKSNDLTERSLRNSKQLAMQFQLPEDGGRKRRQLTEEEKEARRLKRIENAAKRAKLMEEEEMRRAQKKKERREHFWKQNSYTSCNIRLECSDDEEDEEEEQENDDFMRFVVDDEEDQDENVHYVVGDVTRPIQTTNKDAIIIHCVDNSGSWGSGGIFSALSARSLNPASVYELAGKMKDLALGDAHLVSIDDVISREDGKDQVALIVAQTRDKNNRISEVHLGPLAEGLKRVAKEAKRRGQVSVHLPRLGHSTPNFNWYGTEKLIKKELAYKKIPTFIYYFPRQKIQNVPNPVTSTSTSLKQDLITCPSSSGFSSMPPEIPALPDVFTGVIAHLWQIAKEDVMELKRYFIAYNGEIAITFDDTVTHVIVPHKNSKLDFVLKQDYQKAVTVEWLKQSIAARKLLDECDFLAERESS